MNSLLKDFEQYKINGDCKRKENLCNSNNENLMAMPTMISFDEDSFSTSCASS